MVSKNVNTFSHRWNFDHFCYFVIKWFLLSRCLNSRMLYFIITNRFNDTEADKSTGRSIDDRHPFPFPLKSSVYPVYGKTSNHRTNTEPKIIYASSRPVQRTNTLCQFDLFIQISCLLFLTDEFYQFTEIAQDRFVPHESVDHFISKNNRNRVKSSPNVRECTYHSKFNVVFVT